MLINLSGKWSAGILIAFLISISLVILQILFALLQNTESINSMLFSKSNIIMPDKSIDIRIKLEDLIGKDKEFTLKIICYGTSGYNGIVEKISEPKNKKVKAYVVVYDPQKRTHLYEKDKSTIINLITKAENENVVFHRSEILPTIRACVVYDGTKKPVWCCLQTYCYEAHFYTADYEKVPAIFADQDNNVKLLDLMEKIISGEFERLGGKEESLNKKTLSENKDISLPNEVIK
jgi:hypothetical protein